MPKLELADQLEALLFVANDPLNLDRLADLTDTPKAEVTAGLAALAARLGGGLQLMEHEGAYRLVTAPAAGAIVREYLEAETRTELSRPALETLAIIAYRGPITKTQLDELRGVSSDAMLRNLLQRGLVTEQTATKEPGRPVRYSVSHTFLEHFGLASLAELPPLDAPETA